MCWEMSDKGPEYYREISNNLIVLKYFLKNSVFKSLRMACSLRIPADAGVKKFGLGRMNKMPSVADFLKSISVISDFLRFEDEKRVFFPGYNSQGYHSQTVVACLNILFRAGQYKCIEELARMIDANDENVEALQIRNTLLKNRNNMVKRKSD